MLNWYLAVLVTALRVSVKYKNLSSTNRMSNITFLMYNVQFCLYIRNALFDTPRISFVFPFLNNIHEGFDERPKSEWTTRLRHGYGYIKWVHSQIRKFRVNS